LYCMSKRAVLLAVICSSLCAVAHAGNPVAPLPDGDSDSPAEVAEVTVQAHKEKMAKLRLEIKKSVDDFYDAFNKANTVPEYETHCADERPTGSLIASHVCRPRLVDDANDQETQASVFFDNHATVPAYALIFLRMRGYRKQVEELIHNDPNVRQAALHFEALSEQYSATSKEKVKPN
jgi:hypothetical protein